VESGYQRFVMCPGSTDNSRRFTLLAEIAVILAPVLMIVWGTPLLIEEKRRRDAVDFYLMVAAVLIGLALNRYRRESLPEIGLRLDNLLEAGRELLAFTATTCAIILGVGVAFGSVNLGMRFLTQLTVLPFWGLLQQYGLLGVINRRLRQLCARERWSACITAAIFSAIHLPNPALAVATFIGGFFWTRTFQRHPNLIVIGLSHGFMSALLSNSLPHAWLPSMRVGWGFFN